MNKDLLNEIEAFLTTRVKWNSKNFNEEHAQSVEQLKELVEKLVEAKFERDSDRWNGVGALVWNKRTSDSFKFLPVEEKLDFPTRLHYHVINLSFATEAVNSLSNEHRYFEEKKKGN